MTPETFEGILLVNKPAGKTAFSLIAALRRILNIRKIGHAGTLDPFATGVMVLLIGRPFTRLSDRMLTADKEYRAKIFLGVATDSYDCDGTVTMQSDLVPTLEQVKATLACFEGVIDQIPPMFSAKKVQGQKLYELARKGKTIERAPVKVTIKLELLRYEYPYIDINVACSKGTYIRSLAHDIGTHLGCGAHLIELQRTRSGAYSLCRCIDGALLFDSSVEKSLITTHIERVVA